MGEQRRERADAARNRQAILRAAEQLLAENEPEHVSVEQVAAVAGVAKGTVFQRFGSRMGLLRALVENRAHALQAAAAEGPPPLGPEAPALQRLVAFLDALLELAIRNIGLITAHDHAIATQKNNDHSRQANPIYQQWHTHVATLITECRPDLDADTLAHLLLGSLHSDLIAYQLRRGETGRLTDALRQLVTALLTSPGPAPRDDRSQVGT
ncbi:MAG: TetR/AcrR family transcriptional regulator [Kibdelosporangium sp.]